VGWGFDEFGELGDNASIASDRPLLTIGFPTKLAAGDAWGIGQLGSPSFA